MKNKVLYLICANDHLQTAFFCGTEWECARILGIRDTKTFLSRISKNGDFMRGFVHIEKVEAKYVD